MLYNGVFSSANHFSSSLCPVQCKGWTERDSRAALCFLIIRSVASGQLQQTPQLRQSKPAWKRMWLISSKVFQSLLPLLRLCVLQKCPFVFANSWSIILVLWEGNSGVERFESLMFTNEVQLLMKFSNSENQLLASQSRYLKEEA